MFATAALQLGVLWWGLVRVTARDVPGNTFQNAWPLWAATVPLLGWLVARRRTGVVRTCAMRLHALTCALWLVDLALP